MFVYIDKNGVIREIINNKSARLGDFKSDKIYVYLENFADFDLGFFDIWAVSQVISGEKTNETSFKNVEDLEIPFPILEENDYYYFKAGVVYPFFVYTLGELELKYNGLVQTTIRYVYEGQITACGMLTYNVENNIVLEDTLITQSQYEYLLLTLADRTLNDETGQSLQNYIDTKVDSSVQVATADLTERVDNLETKLNNLYGIGAIYISLNPTSPAELYGGTWEEIQDRFLIGASTTYTAGSTGGTTDHNHLYGIEYYTTWSTLGNFQPESSTSGNDNKFFGVRNSNGTYEFGISEQSNVQFSVNKSYEEGRQTLQNGTKIRNEQRTSTENNLPPYLAVYMWKRIA